MNSGNKQNNSKLHNITAETLGSIQLFCLIKQNPRSKDVLTTTGGNIAAVSVGKVSRGDHHGALFGLYLPILVVKLGFAACFDIVQVEHKQQNAVQCVIAAGLRVHFGMPVGIAASALFVHLLGDIA